MDSTIRDLQELLQQWQAIAAELQAQGEAHGDNYAYGALYGMQICEADLKRAIDRLARQANATRTSGKAHVFTRISNRRNLAAGS